MVTVNFIITCIYFYLPAAMANIGANIGRFVPIFRDIKTPIDFGITFRGIRLVGEHKLYGSFIFGTVFGVAFGIVKYLVFDNFMRQYLLLDLYFGQTIFLYTLLSFFALAGDIIKSILKRFFKIAPHSAWIPFDEIDHTTVSLLIASIFFEISAKAVITTIVVYFFLHIMTNIIGYKLKIKKVPY